MGWGVTSQLPLPGLAEPAQIPKKLGWAQRPCLHPPSLLRTPAAWRRRVPGAPGSQVKGRGEGWPSAPAQESPALDAVPTHLAREIVARAAGRRELGGLAIPGGSGARRARHVPGPELSWGPRRATDGAGTAPPSLHPLLLPSPAPAGTPPGSSLCPASPAHPPGRAAPQGQRPRGSGTPRQR